MFSLQADDLDELVRRKHILVRGVVQGVGFRPFVYKTATSLGLTGYVFNSSAGVTIEIEGGESALDEFLQTLKDDPPKLAEIKEISVSDIKVQGDLGFSILGSREETGAFALVPPDAGTCDECWRDFGDPANRRFGYPFTNCTHCGPRYTIIRDIPYDRVTTTMATFTMCAACQAEYEDPEDRRFHAQPVACADCGPRIWFETGTEAGTATVHGTDAAVAGIENAKAGVAGTEIELLLVARAVRDVRLAIDAEPPPIGVDHRQRIKIDIARTLEEADGQHHRKLRRQRGETSQQRAVIGTFGELQMPRILFDAEIRRRKQLLQQDDARAAAVSFAHQALAIGAGHHHVLWKEFERDGSLECQVGCFIDDTHAARTQFLGDPVVRDGLPEHGGTSLQRVDVAEILG